MNLTIVKILTPLSLLMSVLKKHHRHNLSDYGQIHTTQNDASPTHPRLNHRLVLYISGNNIRTGRLGSGWKKTLIGVPSGTRNQTWIPLIQHKRYRTEGRGPNGQNCEVASRSHKWGRSEETSA
ncbi:hypothetical protein PR048_008480 [Dryococelus australis]|uniref:Secreted protein n=1 Tax=Dryococelus australis TaxID=614101 RepID=A0ABQ9HX88_9NEOP|nr:hypothetical protein PR048_008480 [Dryococelus australis]